MEKAIGVPLVVRSRGGVSGGGASISNASRDLLRLFEQQEEGVRERVNELHRIAFGTKE
jgi:molybdate transport repressor ModE-like protein